MRLNLNFDGATLLSDWWGQIKTIFTSIESEYNQKTAALDNDIADEASARTAADTNETAAREAADTALQTNITNETAAREAADNILQAAINAVNERLEYIKLEDDADINELSDGYYEFTYRLTGNPLKNGSGILYQHQAYDSHIIIQIAFGHGGKCAIRSRVFLNGGGYVWADWKYFATQDLTGNLSNLTTTTKTNLVSAINEVNGDISELRGYSSTPIKIGTWIDGTPIWRYAFDRDLTAEEIEYMPNDKCIVVEPPVNSLDNAFIISLSVFFREGETPNAMYDYVCTTQNWCVEAGMSESALNNWNNMTSSCGIYGYIEFATPASNITSS